MLFGCDGNRSRVRREIFGNEKSANQRIPITMFGFTMQATAEQAEPIRALDPFFLQGDVQKPVALGPADGGRF